MDYRFHLPICVRLSAVITLYVFQGAAAQSGGGSQKCNLYQGKWVYDNSYPLYNSGACPFIEGFDCQRYGRPDKDYLKYRWKPQGCDLPRFDGVDFLQRWKGKKIMFVGDSLSLNMWVSLNCMIHAAVPNTTTSFFHEGPFYNRTFEEYGVSMMFYHSWFLVDVVTENTTRILKLDSIDSGKDWLGFDLLIFNTGHWWYHRGRIQPWDVLEEGNMTYKDMDRNVALFKGLTTWAKWADSNINPAQTKVFFQGTSPVHLNGTEWGGADRGTCRGETEPLKGSIYPTGPPLALEIVKSVLGNMTMPVELLDVTLMSQLRKDGHTSTYSSQPKFVDCSHWCLAGVPDTWNHLLYASLVDDDSALSSKN